MTIYCATAGCGHRAEYSSIKPKFCAVCGTPYDAAFRRAPASQIAPAAAPTLAQPTYAPQPQYQPQSNANYGQPPEGYVGHVPLPKLTSDILFNEHDTGGKLTLTPESLATVGDLSMDRAPHTNRPPMSAGDAEYTSSAYLRDQLVETAKANVQGGKAPQAPMPVVRPSAARQRKQRPRS